jgi:hypothetical protein
LVLPLLVVAAAPATAATRNAPPYLRTTLDDTAPAPAAAAPAPRRIRSSLDDAGSVPLRALERPSQSAGHAEFPLEKSVAKAAGRLIRLSLDDGQATYGHLVLAQPASRRIRTSLD